jgi:hypothetical protein
VHAFVCTTFVNSDSSTTLSGFEMRGSLLAKVDGPLQTAHLP